MRVLGIAIAVFLVGGEGVFGSNRPNVVLIVCDDLNDYVEGMGGHSQAHTPAMRALADSGVLFRRAYSNNPVCAPSRASFLTGLYPQSSGNLFWDKWYENPVLSNSKTLMEHFRDNGYHVMGSGKLMHHSKRDLYDEFAHDADYGPFVYDGKRNVAHPAVPEPFHSIGCIDGSYGPLSDIPYANDQNPVSGWIYGSWRKKRTVFRYNSPTDRDLTPDERNAEWAAGAIKRLSGQSSDKPFLLALGFIRPHTPLHAPRKYFDRFPLDQVHLPVIKPGDIEDTHYEELFDIDVKGLRYYRTLTESYPSADDGLRAFTRAYLACVAAVDDCVGRVVEAIDQSPFRENTIIVLTSDHGWNMGQKEFLFKNSLWEESTRVPFIVRAPDVTNRGGIVEQPVSLIDLYPTLVDLCDLEGDTRKNAQGAQLDGFSVRPLLEDPAGGKWEGPEGALTMVHADENARTPMSKEHYDDYTKQHWSLRTKRWRYTRYNNGAEELYDHENDPHEWNNLADDSAFQETRDGLRKMLRSRLSL